MSCKSLFAVLLALLAIDSSARAATLQAGPAHLTARRIPPAAAVSGVVNLNTASDSELRVLPGIGPAKAQRIIAQRSTHKFTSIDQLMNVKGIGRKTYRKLKPHLAITGATTLKKMPKEKAPAAHAEADEREPSDAAGEPSSG